MIFLSGVLGYEFSPVNGQRSFIVAGVEQSGFRDFAPVAFGELRERCTQKENFVRLFWELFKFVDLGYGNAEVEAFAVQAGNVPFIYMVDILIGDFRIHFSCPFSLGHFLAGIWSGYGPHK